MKVWWSLMASVAICSGCAIRANERPHCETTLTLPREMRDAEIIVLGETHGTRETPRFVGDVVCAFLASGASITLGLEMSEDLTDDLKDFMASDGGAAAQDELLKSDHWRRRAEHHDGRGSIAMFELLERMRRLAKSGAPIAVAGIDGRLRPRSREESARMPHERDRIMSEHATALRMPGRKLILLVGGLHAIKYPLEADYPLRQPPTASFLDPTRAWAIALRERGGTAWACIAECGIQNLRPRYTDAALDGQIVPERAHGYDAVAYIGPVTASEPKVFAHPAPR